MQTDSRLVNPEPVLSLQPLWMLPCPVFPCGAPITGREVHILYSSISLQLQLLSNVQGSEAEVKGMHARLL